MMTFIYFLSITLFIILCVFTCLIVMMQESKSTGLGASFGGEASDSVFGTSTADVLKQLTAWLGVVFLASCLVLSFWTSAMGRTQGPTPVEIEKPVSE